MRRNPEWLSKPGEQLRSEIERLEAEAQLKRDQAKADRQAAAQASAANAAATATGANTDDTDSASYTRIKRQALPNGAVSNADLSFDVDYDVVVIGSGYGGAIAAARLSALAPIAANVGASERRPFRVCVLERGLEYVQGSFPSAFAELPAHVRIAARNAGVSQAADALFDLHIGGDVWSLTGNGLGGGSLINAGVCERASAEVLRDEAWPSKWRMPPPLDADSSETDGFSTSKWGGLYGRAQGELQPVEWTTQRPKSEYVEWLGEQLDEPVRAANVAVVPPGLEAITTKGVTLDGCIECGDCFTGCNHNAKRTLSTNYLADAYCNGADIFTGVTVRGVTHERADSATWSVSCVLTDEKKCGPKNHGRAGIIEEEFEIRARYVVIAAGTYGSTELLMRSRERRRGLTLSSQLGHGFSANGDFFAARYNGHRPANNAPKETTPANERKVGPTITRLLDMRARPGASALAIEEISVPAALRRVFEEIVSTGNAIHRWTRWDFSSFKPSDRDPLALDEAAIDRSMLYASMGRDSAGGRLVKLPGFSTARSDGGLAVDWPELDREVAFSNADKALGIAQSGELAYLASPLWRPVPEEFNELDGVPEKRVFTTHPLGGCRMADEATKGVVDPLGRVFSMRAKDESETYTGLFVLDGSIIPLSLGINPLLTISALAEGMIDEWEKEFGWQKLPTSTSVRGLPTKIKIAPGQTPQNTPAATSLGFSERMVGPCEGGEASGAQLELTTHFEPIADVHAFLIRAKRGVKLTGHLRIANGVNKSAKIPLVGTVAWFERERHWVGARIANALIGYAQNRLLADVVSDNDKKVRGLPREPLWRRLVQAFRTASTVGDVRLLRYDFEALEKAATIAVGSETVTLAEGAKLHGAKRVEYVAGSNPWRQLSEMDLLVTEPGRKARKLARIEFDKLYMLDRYETRLQLTGFRDAPSAWLDLFSMSMYMLRVITSVHFWSFRGADFPVAREYRRLPAASDFAGEQFEYEEHLFTVPRQFDVDEYRSVRAEEKGKTITLRLTKIRRKAIPAPTRNPIVLFHGFGSGGVQFTHEAIPTPLARYLANEMDADIFVAEMRTSIGLDSSHEQWTMDQVALQDIPALVEQVLILTGAPQVRVVAHCIGSAMFCMAVLSPSSKVFRSTSGAPESSLASCIESAVLLQVGPIIHLPEENRARAYVGRWLTRFAGLTEISSSTDDRTSAAGRLAERFIGAISYPVSERDAFKLTGDLEKNRRFTNAHRSAMVFGRLFNMRNMADSVLDAMGDLLAHCNLKTYSQTIHYTFLERLTDMKGVVGAYVNEQNIRERMNFPIRFIHGAENAVFDPETTARSAAELSRINPDTRYEQHPPIPGYGHLDPLVGINAAKDVFPYIKQYLEQPLTGASAAPTFGWEAARPSIGPWIARVRDADPIALPPERGLLVSIAFAANERLGVPGYLVVQLFVDNKPKQFIVKANDSGGVYAGDEPDDISAFDVLIEHKHVVRGKKLELHVYGIYCSGVPNATPRVPATAELQKQFAAGNIRPVDLYQSPADLLAQFSLTVPPAEIPLIAAWIERASLSPSTAEVAIKELLAEDVKAHLSPPPASVILSESWVSRYFEAALADGPTTHFALASCRLAPAIFDRDMADGSMRDIRAQLVDKSQPLDFALMVGDQVYVDGTAGQFDPTGGDYYRFREVYREAWTSYAQSEVMRRIPCYFMFDDHEVYNNWAPQDVSDPSVYKKSAVDWRWDQDQKVGLDYAWRYQLQAGPLSVLPHPPLAPQCWYPFNTHGQHYFMCDTRSERKETRSVDRRGARIMGAAQAKALYFWLAMRQNAAPSSIKFVVSPVPMFPIAAGSAVCSDAWARFPESRNEFLDFVVAMGIDNVVILSGDAHCFLDATITITKKDHRSVTIRNITTAGLYAPYPFANSQPEDFLATANDAILVGPNTGTAWRYTVAKSASSIGGWTLIGVDEKGALTVEFRDRAQMPAVSQFVAREQ